ncbi:hypothetical protein TWF696_005422 [Orbilia brochopaga]|uniref:Uncharacterized protein n=1 Tax=Orbilia brochopaga TaxID=3140254 RepID=A0AAV9V4M1_9PEZI
MYKIPKSALFRPDSFSRHHLTRALRSTVAKSNSRQHTYIYPHRSSIHTPSTAILPIVRAHIPASRYRHRRFAASLYTPSMMSTLSRTPTPTGGLATPSEASTEATELSGRPDTPADDDSDEDDDDYGYGVEYDNGWSCDRGGPFYLDNPIFHKMIEDLTAITAASTDPAVGTSTTALRQYYNTRWKELAADPAYVDVPLTTPPCPKVRVRLVDQVRYGDNCKISCPCCLPDDLPWVPVVASEVDGGVITHGAFLNKLRVALYGDESDGDGQNVTSDVGASEAAAGSTAMTSPQSVVDGIPAGEAGVRGWNCMSMMGRYAASDLMGQQLFVYLAKPLVGGGLHNSYRVDDTDGCGREVPMPDSV